MTESLICQQHCCFNTGVAAENLRNYFLSKGFPEDPLFTTSADLAKAIIGIPQVSRTERSVASALSAVFNGKRGASSDLANQLSHVFTVALKRRGYGEEFITTYQQELKNLLAQTRVDTMEDRQTNDEVQAFYQLCGRVSRANCLLLLEVRDLPREFTREKHLTLMQPLVKSIVEGLSIGLIQPFISHGGEYTNHILSRRTKGFFVDVLARVRSTYARLREQVGIYCEKNNFQEKKHAAINRIRLYERNHTMFRIHGTPFLHSREMLVIQLASDFEWAPDELWNWIQAEERDFFVQRESNVVPTATDRFQPFVYFFKKYKRLPSQEEISLACQELFSESYDTVPEDFWTEFTEEKKKRDDEMVALPPHNFR